MDRDDLEGYLVGVTRRLAERRAAGSPDPDLESELTLARATLSKGDLPGADRRLRDIDRALDLRRPQMEMLDRPRGLVGYTAIGDRGVPPTGEEEPLANRIRLVGRLATLRESEGRDVAPARRRLVEAQAAYDAGDRPAARRALDAAHADLERSSERARRSP